MSPAIILVLVIGGLLISVVMSSKLKINLGIPCLVFSFIIGYFFLGIKINAIVEMWPVRVMFQLLVLTIFFGFAVQNGMLRMVAENLLYKFRKHVWFMPFAMLLITVVLGMLGGPPPVAAAIMAVLAFSIGNVAGYHPLLLAFIAGNGAMLGSCVPFGVCGTIVRTTIMETGYPELAELFTLKTWIAMFISFLLVMIVLYFVLGAYKIKNVNIEKPAPATPIQKKNLVLFLIVIACSVLPNVLKTFVSSPILSKVSGFLDIQVCCLIGAIIACFLKLANEREVIKAVPWNTILMVGGVSTLMAIGTAGGIGDYVSAWVGSNVPSSLVGTILMFFGGFLSFFTGGITSDFPMLAPMVQPLASNLALSPAVLYASIAIGAVMTGISPFSTGGAITLANSGRDEVGSKKLFNQMFLLALVELAFTMILSLVGFYTLFA